MGWGLLATEPARLFVAGAHCQPWLADVNFTPIPASEFSGYHETNQVKIAWTLEVESLGPTSDTTSNRNPGRRDRRRSPSPLSALLAVAAWKLQAPDQGREDSKRAV